MFDGTVDQARARDEVPTQDPQRQERSRADMFHAPADDFGKNLLIRRVRGQPHELTPNPRALFLGRENSQPNDGLSSKARAPRVPIPANPSVFHSCFIRGQKDCGFAFPLTAFLAAVSSRLLSKRKEHYEIDQEDSHRPSSLLFKRGKHNEIHQMDFHRPCGLRAAIERVRQ